MNQPFDPLEFWRQAQNLSTQNNNEVTLRTAIGRAYYSLFLLARERLKVSGRRGIHATVVQRVKARDRTTGDQLHFLMRLRHTADYQLVPQKPQERNWQRNWQTVRTTVLHILPKIQAI